MLLLLEELQPAEDCGGTLFGGVGANVDEVIVNLLAPVDAALRRGAIVRAWIRATAPRPALSVHGERVMITSLSRPAMAPSSSKRS